MTLKLDDVFIKTKPEVFAVLAAVCLCLIVLTAVSIRISRRNDYERDMMLPEGEERRSRRRHKSYVFRKTVIALLVILLALTITCTVLSWTLRNGNISYITRAESEQVSVHYLYSMDNKAFAVATLTGFHCYYYAEDGRIKASTIAAEEAAIEFITDGSAPRLVDYREIPVRYEAYKGEVVQAKRLEREARTYYVLYLPQGSVSFQ